MTDKIVILSTCSSEEEAERLARRLVEERVAACVSVVPGIRSYYRWKGELETANECMLVIKSSRDRFSSLVSILESAHSYETPEALAIIAPVLHAANIDLKAFTENFYSRVTLTHLQPVLETLRWLRHETQVWFEITNLVIPTLNDAESEFKQLCGWVLENLGDDVPLHFTAFHPDFKLQDKPPTPPETLHRARRIAREMGLKFVYEGNIFSDGGNTLCPGCRRVIIQRSWHSILANDARGGKCAHCGAAIAGVFTTRQAEQRRQATCALAQERRAAPVSR